MSRRCELTGKAVQSGNLVSHSNRKTRTRFLPNLCNVTLISDTLGRAFKLRIAAASIRTVEHRGGLDAFLLKARDEELSQNARELKREIAKKGFVDHTSYDTTSILKLIETRWGLEPLGTRDAGVADLTNSLELGAR